MIITSAHFVTSAVQSPQYPSGILPEIAFSGRSNVGKSSLINTLLNRKHLVKTSSTPGRTRLINFFEINASFLFVDLPGYGYAKVPISEKKKWRPMIETYLSTRKTLKGVILVLDIRRVPGQKEHQFIDWLCHFNIPKMLVITKSDKLSKPNRIKNRKSIAESLSVDENELTLFSAKSRLGKDDVWEGITNLIASG
ncbi:MAG: ribosome biogenesis GTP-binding protein YihA/YsxC [Desulfobacterales bacterium]|jgi:GTP-binding protein|nr:ribosome biogenesis GTP-binding protein YihA/YsxC [Desulfobacterales bacterium]